MVIVGEDYGEGSSIMQERSYAFAMKAQMWLLDPPTQPAQHCRHGGKGLRTLGSFQHTHLLHDAHPRLSCDRRVYRWRAIMWPRPTTVEAPCYPESRARENYFCRPLCISRSGKKLLNGCLRPFALSRSSRSMSLFPGRFEFGWDYHLRWLLQHRDSRLAAAGDWPTYTARPISPFTA